MSMISTLNILDGWMGDFLNTYCINYILFSADGNSFADHWILCGTRIVFWFVWSIDYICFYLVLKTKCGWDLFAVFANALFRGNFDMLVDRCFFAAGWTPPPSFGMRGANMWQVDICAPSKGIYKTEFWLQMLLCHAGNLRSECNDVRRCWYFHPWAAACFLVKNWSNLASSILLLSHVFEVEIGFISTFRCFRC